MLHVTILAGGVVMRLPCYQIALRAVVATAMLGSRLAAGTSITHAHCCEHVCTHGPLRAAVASGRGQVCTHRHDRPDSAVRPLSAERVATIVELQPHVHFRFLGFDITTPLAPGSNDTDSAGVTLQVGPMIAPPTARIGALAVSSLSGWLVEAARYLVDSRCAVPGEFDGSMAQATFLVDGARRARSQVLLM